MLRAAHDHASAITASIANPGVGATLLSALRERIEAKTAQIGVVGLGYVGLAVACKLAEAGFTIHGLELRSDRVDLINTGTLPFQGQEPGLEQLLREVVIVPGRLRASTDPRILREADVILIAVETPVDSDTKVPKYEALTSALMSVGKVMKPGALIIVESTIAPGTMAELVCPALEQASGWVADQDFFLGHCPERVMPGRLLKNLSTESRVCGGSTLQTSRVMTCLYRHIVEADLDQTDWITAEMVKTTENAYRDVQIAFANEIALICEGVGADVWRVRELVNKSKGRNMHLPGSGVGGHCIPKDPWLLAYSALNKGHSPRLIPAARHLNDEMPLHVADLLGAALAEVGCQIRGSRIAVLGYAYLENSDDTRNSPSQSLIDRLQELGAHVVIHDPHVADYQVEIGDVIAGADALAIMVRHEPYLNLSLASLRSLMNHAVVVDGRHVFEPEQVRQAGFVFRGVGRGDYAR